MKVKVFFLIVFSRLIRGVGMGLGVSGIAFTIWFFFLSSSDLKYLWGLVSISEFFVGYFIYRFAYKYIYDE